MSLFKSFWADPRSSTAMDSSSLIPLPTVSALLERPDAGSRSPDRRMRAQGPISYDPDDPLMPLQRAETALQRQIQDCLDAQSEALFPRDTTHDDSLTTQSQHRLGAGGAVPRRQPIRPAMSLASARQSISSAMQQLSDVKSRQSALVDERIAGIDAALSTLAGWHDKDRTLRAEMAAVTTAANDDERVELTQQEQTLQNDINELEARLAELKSQQRAVRLRLSQKTNTLNSELASFRESLSLVESSRRDFLRRPPRDLFRSLPDASFLSLKPERRSPKLAEDALNDAKGLETQNQESIEEEREALDDGMSIWHDVLSQVAQVEAAVQSELKKLAGHSASSDSADADSSMGRLRQHLNATITELERQVSDAEAKSRSLLVCCIGAELEALRRGREVLAQATRMSQSSVAASGTLLGDDEAHTFADQGASSPVHEYKSRRLKQGSGSTTDESDADPQNLLISGSEAE